ncbi:Sugar ABC transporter ATPase [Vibrio aestuarianus]|nr:Sugar ABC transporter ATPase [Vibrio aestuarianus]
MRWILLWLLISPSALAEKILVIESYDQSYEWDQSYFTALHRKLTPRHELETFEMNTKRIPASQYLLMAEKAFVAYQQMQPDVVVLGDDNALVYMLPKLYNEPISIVFLGINDNPRKLITQYQGQAKVSGILERTLFVKTMGEIGRILEEDKRKVLVLFDSGNTAKIALEYMKTQVSMIENNLGITTEISSITTDREWYERISSAKERGFGAIVIGLYHTLVGDSGNHIDAEKIMAWTNQNTPVPLFGFWDFSIGKGKAAGGVVLIGSDQGQMAADIVVRILDHNEDASQIPIQIGLQGKAIYHADEMARWGLSIPKGWTAIE